MKRQIRSSKKSTTGLPDAAVQLLQRERLSVGWKMATITKMSNEICRDCPALKIIEAAESAVKREREAGLLTEKYASVSKILSARSRIVLEETRKSLGCDGPKKDDKGVLFCPLPLGNVDFLVNTNVDGELESAHEIAANNRSAGFGAEMPKL